MYPKYRDNYLPARSLKQIREIPDKAQSPVIIPTGAIEQHGPHLPVGVDALLGQARLDYALPRLPPDCKVWVGPAIQIGKSNEHTGFPGTLAINKSSLRRQLLAIAAQLHDWGFRTLLVLNTHGGNSAVLRMTLGEIEDNFGMSAEALSLPVEREISAQEALYGFHAGEVETSLMLEILDGRCIRMEDATCCFPARIEDPGELRPECAPAIFSWVTADISPDGVMGDASIGTPDKGRVWMEAETQALLNRLTEICRREPKQ